MNRQDILSLFHELCRYAEKETLPYFRKTLHVDNKMDGGFDPVTQADRNAEKVLRQCISKHYPNHGIIGEEFGEKASDSEYCWIIDPIDGTRAFISGMPVWSTLIGLYRNGVPYAGIMHQPFTGEKYICDGEASFYERGSERIELQTSSETDISKAIMMATTPDMFSPEELLAFKRVNKAVSMVRYGGDSYAYCQLASGQVSLVIEADLQAYDVAALIPIIQNAGGIFTDWQGNSPAHGGQIIAAANADIHAESLELLNL